MTTPLTNRPKITLKDISLGYVNRYFAQHISNPKIVEIDNTQYRVLKQDPHYKMLEIRWIITGNAYDTFAADGSTIFGTSHQNQVTINWHTKQMPGLNRILSNPLEFFVGSTNTPTLPDAEKQPINKVLY